MNCSEHHLASELGPDSWTIPVPLSVQHSVLVMQNLYVNSGLGSARSMEQILLVHFPISLLQQIFPVIYFSLHFLFVFPLARQISFLLIFFFFFLPTSVIFLVRKPSTPETFLRFLSLRIFHAIFCTILLLLPYGGRLLAFLLAQTAVLITAPAPGLCSYYFFFSSPLFKTFRY